MLNRWYSQLPAGWHETKLKYVAPIQRVEASSKEHYVGLENIESCTGNFLATETKPEGLALAFKKGDVLFGKLRPYLAKCWIASFDGCCSTEFFVLRPEAVSADFLWSVLMSNEFIEAVNGSTFGAKMPRANWDFVGELGIPLPPDCVSVAGYIQNNTTAINKIIQKKQQLLSKLSEYRQSVITQAVTKGLDPNSEMKDSGVEWIGEIPKHWSVASIGRIYNVTLGKMLQPKKKDPSDTQEKYLCAGSISWKGVKSDYVKEMWFSKSDKLELKLQDGDALIVEGGAGFGMCCLYNGENAPCYFQNSIIRLRTESKYLSEFAPYWISLVHKRYLRRICGEATFAHYTKEKVCRTPIVVIPENELSEVLGYLSNISFRLGKIEESITSEIVKLQEYRSSLITAAVTGQIDCTKEAA